MGIPPIHVAKTEITLEEVLEKLSSLEKSLPSILENASRVNESIENIGKTITTLEASTTLDNQNLRIGKLEESMETLSLIFSSLKFKKEKVFVGKEQKFMYVPKVSALKQYSTRPTHPDLARLIPASSQRKVTRWDLLIVSQGT
jgi:hypothetical protein